LHTNQRIHQHAGIDAVCNAHIAHAHQADGLYIGHANGFGFHATDLDTPVLADLVLLIVCNGFLPACANCE